MPPELPDSKSGLKKLARRGVTAAARARRFAAERREGRNELLGAFVVLPLVRDMAPMLPFVGQLGLAPELRDALICYAGSEFTDGDLSDALWGGAVGGVGAYSYQQKGVLGGLFGG